MRNQVRKQELQRLVKLCKRHDLDIQDYDYRAYSYQEIKEMILKDAGIKTEQMVDDEFKQWESMAEFYDSLPLEDKAVVEETLQQQEVKLVNCLIIKINHRRYHLAKLILQAKYKGNLMTKNFTNEGEFRPANQIAWIMGPRDITNMILEDLQKHNILYRIIRDYPLRRRFLHYYHGRFFHMKEKEFREAVAPQSKRKLRERKLLKLTD